MRDVPIIFSGAMVRALLAGRKTQTRRTLYRLTKNFSSAVFDRRYLPPALDLERPQFRPGEAFTLSPWHKCQVGDRLWVRETVRADELPNGRDGVRYVADDEWRPIEATKDAAELWVALNHYRGKRGVPVNSIHMPRWVSRLTLTVTDVRVERLQDISEEDARAEGAFVGKATGRVFMDVTSMRLGGNQWQNCRNWFADLWDGLRGEDDPSSWDMNHWIVALTFDLRHGNIDA